MRDIHLAAPSFPISAVINQIRECLEKGWTGAGFKTVEFESRWREFTGCNTARFLNSATAGLHLAVRCLASEHGWVEGDEIISTPLTFVSTNHAIVYEGLRPVFADVDEYLCLDPVSVESRITDRTRAVMFVGMAGNTGQLGAIVELCERRGLKLILDAAHMAGTLLDGKQCGPMADAVVYSFQAVKNLPTGDSGMLCFKEPRLDAHAGPLSWLGIDRDTYTRTTKGGGYKWQYSVEEVGFKYQGNSIMAAVGLAGIDYLDEGNKGRRLIAERYDAALTGVDAIRTVPIAPGCTPSRHLYQVRVSGDRDAIMAKMNEARVFPGMHYACNTDYPMYDYGRGTCPNAEQASRELISLPLHLRLHPDDVDRVVEVLLGAVR